MVLRSGQGEVRVIFRVSEGLLVKLQGLRLIHNIQSTICSLISDHRLGSLDIVSLMMSFYLFQKFKFKIENPQLSVDPTRKNLLPS